MLAGLLTLASAVPGVGAVLSRSAMASATLDCRDPIGAADTPPSYVKAIGGAVALQTRSTTRRALQTAATSDPNVPSLRFRAKTPLFVRTGRAAKIIIPRKQLGRLAMTWGNTDHDGIATRAFTVGPCPGQSKWIVFPGGYYLTRPACIDLTVRAAGSDTRVRVGVGAPCPGQRRPPEPSDS
jgi:hypothetical protein